ncbi:unnamed protein product [Protopolystoma xenopodis]|uniref:Uncharacterized protein n=1 Tax=Protopolystoma xenopodis TaxID=117903 RepID=A0A448WP85_9PLAT|nr:unnamed protein product [Protopolystoma xenopodis]
MKTPISTCLDSKVAIGASPHYNEIPEQASFPARRPVDTWIYVQLEQFMQALQLRKQWAQVLSRLQLGCIMAHYQLWTMPREQSPVEVTRLLWYTLPLPHPHLKWPYFCSSLLKCAGQPHFPWVAKSGKFAEAFWLSHRDRPVGVSKAQAIRGLTDPRILRTAELRSIRVCVNACHEAL